MQTTFRFHTDELDEQTLRRVLEALRTLYPHQEVDLSVATKVDDEMDETEYLLSTEANRKHLLEAVERMRRGEPGIPFDIESFRREHQL